MMRFAKGTRWVILLLLANSGASLFAKPLSLPDDPRQSITYWRQHTISPEKDSMAAMARSVFSVLLRAWDSSRLEPELFVVRSSSGPWAASLADGNILLTRAAIETCLKFGKHRAKHLLAFILAHELAHQRSDDLWHQRFFRLVGNQGGDVKNIILKDIQTNKKAWQNVQQKETQADHDGLVMMASVGYDPYQVLDKKDFFTAWVENIWREPCATQKQGKPTSLACQQAKDRATRTHAQLTAVATQSTLYEMGVQSFIAGHYKEARRYLTAYGRDYTSRAVLSAIGLSYFAEAMEQYRLMVNQYGDEQPVYYYPLLLDAHAHAMQGQKGQDKTVKRSISIAETDKFKNKIRDKLAQSIKYYEKAVRLEPGNPRTYILMAFSYLLDNNPYMVRGIIQGKYIPRFGRDKAADLVLAMTSGIEGNIEKTEQGFATLIGELTQHADNTIIPADVLLYSAYYNSAAYAAYLGRQSTSAELWQELAQYARSEKRPLLFKLAVAHITNKTASLSVPGKAPTVSGMRLGDKFTKRKISAKIKYRNDLWIEGDKHEVYRLNNGSRFVIDADKRIIKAWQDASSASLNNAVAVGDTSERAMKALGTPDRQLHLMSGEYLAYDEYGLAVHVIDDKVAGWFLF